MMSITAGQPDPFELAGVEPTERGIGNSKLKPTITVPLRPMVNRIICRPILDFTKAQQLPSGIWIPADTRPIKSWTNGSPGEFECHTYEVIAIGPTARFVEPGMYVEMQNVYPWVIQWEGTKLHFYRDKEVRWVYEDWDVAELEANATALRVLYGQRIHKKKSVWA